MPTGNIEIPPMPLSGTIEAHLHEAGGASPVNIIRTDQDWAAHTTIRLSGVLSQFISGNWHVHVNLESVGPGGEHTFFDSDSTIPIPEPDDTYECVLNVPAGSVSAAHQGTPYHCAVTVTYRGPMGNPGPIAGYVDMGIVQFYNP